MSADLLLETLTLGPESAGLLLTPEEFDAADFEEGWRYELVQGVLIVTPPPGMGERDPNDELGYLLRQWTYAHPAGDDVSVTAPEQTIRLGPHRRRPDRAVWAGLGRLPRRGETPTIVIEFASRRRRDRRRDYETKRDEYLAAGVREYWVIDRFQKKLTVFTPSPGGPREAVFVAGQVYRTDLLPGFELPLDRLLAVGLRWDEAGEEP